MVDYQARNNLTLALRKRIFERDEKTCQYCGGYADAIDHIIPFSVGGDESEENLVACCSTCNSIAHNQTFKSFKEKRDFIQRKREKRGKKIVFKKDFRFERICKLVTCGKKFKTNRPWQDFHHPDCQQKWQKLLRRKHADVVVETAYLKEEITKLTKITKEFITITIDRLEKLTPAARFIIQLKTILDKFINKK